MKAIGRIYKSIKGVKGTKKTTIKFLWLSLFDQLHTYDGFPSIHAELPCDLKNIV